MLQNEQTSNGPQKIPEKKHGYEIQWSVLSVAMLNI